MVLENRCMSKEESFIHSFKSFCNLLLERENGEFPYAMIWFLDGVVSYSESNIGPHLTQLELQEKKNNIIASVSC